MARRRHRGRKVNGILLLNKSAGETSNSALQKAKRLYNAAKAGHTGSLDPLAEGLLPVCFGEATKISAFLLDADKRYRCECKLGETTNTGDADGELLQTRPVPEIDQNQIITVLESFLGEQDQIPPMYSALKKDGKALYELAREGIEVERKPRRITLYSIELNELGADRLVFDVHCSKGTYVRTLVEHIGEKLGCGAHVTGLRRLSVAGFQLKGAKTLHELETVKESEGFDGLDDMLLPMEDALTHWPEVNLNGDAAFYIRQGQPVLIPRAPTEGLVRLFAEDDFIGVGKILDDGRVAPKRLLSQS